MFGHFNLCQSLCLSFFYSYYQPAHPTVSVRLRICLSSCFCTLFTSISCSLSLHLFLFTSLATPHSRQLTFSIMRDLDIPRQNKRSMSISLSIFVSAWISIRLCVSPLSFDCMRPSPYLSVFLFFHSPRLYLIPSISPFLPLPLFSNTTFSVTLPLYHDRLRTVTKS